MKSLIVIFLSILFFNSNVYSQVDSTGRWFSRALLPTPRQEVVHAILNGKIYVPGGLAFGGVGSSLVEVYNIATNTWSTAAPMPEPLHHMGFAAVNGRLYVLGGYRGNSFVPNIKVYAMNPDSNVWVEKNPMLIARGAHIALTYLNKIYVIGGVITGFTVSNRTDIYDPSTDSWIIGANMPTPREHLSGAIVDSLIYVAGGRSGGGNFNILEAYSPATNSWSTKQPMPTARGGLAAASLNGRLYVFGGEIPGVYPQNEEYNPVSNSWRTMTPMKTPRHGIGAVTAGDSIYIIGGAVVEGLSVSDVNDIFTLAPLVLNLTVLIEGLYDPSANAMVRDTARVYLRKIIPPFQIVDSSKIFLNSNGTGAFKFNRAFSDSSYYIVVKHRNSITTWSASGHSFAPSVMNYNFTTSSSQAFGNNLKLEGTRYTVYSGDVNQDGFVNLSDIILIQNDAVNFNSGYLKTDINGDFIINLIDLLITSNNSVSFVKVISP